MTGVRCRECDAKDCLVLDGDHFRCRDQYRCAQVVRLRAQAVEEYEEVKVWRRNFRNRVDGGGSSR